MVLNDVMEVIINLMVPQVSIDGEARQMDSCRKDREGELLEANFGEQVQKHKDMEQRLVENNNYNN